MYGYGFQGQESDDEVKGKGNSISYKYRMHDPRIGRFFAVDPLAKKYPELTPYQFSHNSPIGMVELEGLEGIWVYDTKGVHQGTIEYDGGATGLLITNEDINITGASINMGVLKSEITKGTLVTYSDGLSEFMLPSYFGTLTAIGIQLEANRFTSKAKKAGRGIWELNAGKEIEEEWESKEAKDIGTDGVGKTFRHLASQAYWALTLSELDARVLGDAHEATWDNDDEMKYHDLAINYLGRKYAADHKDEIDLSTNEGVAQFLNDMLNYALKLNAMEPLEESDYIFTGDPTEDNVGILVE